MPQIAQYRGIILLLARAFLTFPDATYFEEFDDSIKSDFKDIKYYGIDGNIKGDVNALIAYALQLKNNNIYGFEPYAVNSVLFNSYCQKFKDTMPPEDAFSKMIVNKSIDSLKLSLNVGYAGNVIFASANDINNSQPFVSSVRLHDDKIIVKTTFVDDMGANTTFYDYYIKLQSAPLALHYSLEFDDIYELFPLFKNDSGFIDLYY